MSGNESCMDAVNVSVAFQKLAAACCMVFPVGEIQISARRLFQKLVSMALKLQGTFKLDPLNMTLGAIARLSTQQSSNLLPPAGTDEAFNIQVKPTALEIAHLTLQFPDIKVLTWGLQLGKQTCHKSPLVEQRFALKEFC